MVFAVEPSEQIGDSVVEYPLRRPETLGLKNFRRLRDQIRFTFEGLTLGKVNFLDSFFPTEEHGTCKLFFRTLGQDNVSRDVFEVPILREFGVLKS